MTDYRGRFAPSPTGPLHLGSLVAALGSWLDARHHGGCWLIRIEDIDPPRAVAGAAEAQLRVLQAHGLTSDEPVLWQSTRGVAYDAALRQLEAAGLLFDCRCSRADLADHGGIHRFCVATDSQRDPAKRLRGIDTMISFEDRLHGTQRQSLADEVGDTVLRRVDGLYAYQLAVVVDDAAQGITDVVRGADLLDSTPRQIFLQRALDLPTPRYLHLPLVLDAHGRKLGKSLAALPLDGSEPLRGLQAAWRFLLPETDSPEATAVDRWLRQAVARYSPARLRRSDAQAAVR